MITVPFSLPFYTGVAVTSLVPDVFPVALDGRPYEIDHKIGLRIQSIPLLRQQSDVSTTPGESSLNPEGLWRRSQVSWHGGAGQVYRDRDGSVDSRFRSSKGIDPWQKWQLSLLPDTANRRASANTNLALVTAGTYLYAGDGQTLVQTQNINLTSPVWTTVTGTPAVALTGLASDGFTIYAAYGASGIYTTTRGAAAAASHITGTVNLVGYVKGRLMVSNGPSLYNPTAAGALPAALYTHPNTDFTWVGFAEGPQALYAAGFSGDKSLIYATKVKADGTALDVPVIAGELPDGEVVRSIQGYANFMLIGTDTGVRMAAINADGSLSVGAKIDTTSPVRCLEPQARFVWYGLTNYDTTSTGLGRVDLSVFTDAQALAPAYATDLMATAQGSVLAVVTFGTRRVFAVSGIGFFAQTDTLVASGTIDSGLIGFGVAEPKIGVYLDVRHSTTGGGSHTAYVSADGGTFQITGTVDDDSNHDAPLPVGQLTGETLEVRHTLTRSATPTSGPVVTRWTLRAYPTASTGLTFLVPVILHDTVTVNGTEYHFDPAAEWDALVSLRSSKELTSFQMGTRNYSVFVDDVELRAIKPTEDRTGFQGSAIIKLKFLSTEEG